MCCIKYVSYSVLVILFAGCFALTGCSTDGRAIEDPSSPPLLSKNSNSGGYSNRYLLGYWDCYIPESHDRIDMIPARGAEVHINARRFMEYIPCSNCIQIVNLSVDHDDSTLTAGITFTHPYDAKKEFTAFDTRAIVISDASHYYPEFDVWVPDPGMGDFTLISADGHTKLWNTVEFPYGSGEFPILEYSQGNFASHGGFTGTLNPYLSIEGFNGRSSFSPGEVTGRTFVFHLSPGEIRFGYAIDVSWAEPLVKPPVDVFDFPSEANCAEAVFRQWIVADDPILTDEIGSTGSGCLTVYDAQGSDTVGDIEFECPDLWSGLLTPYDVEYEEFPSGSALIRAYFTFTNELGAEPGYYSPFIRVKDTVEDTWLGDVNHLYRHDYLTVHGITDTGLDGSIVYAKMSEQPGDILMMQVVMMDLATISEQILYDAPAPVGCIISKPRLNSTGTHALFIREYFSDMGHHHICVTEIGEDAVNISPPEPHDFMAEFLQDGESILVVANTDDGPETGLYTMDYDGSDRALVSTTPERCLSASWCPDGQRIAVALVNNDDDTIDSDIWIYDIVADEYTCVFSESGYADNPQWSPVPVDGEYLLAFDTNADFFPDGEYSRSNITILEPGSGEMRKIRDETLLRPAFSPDAAHIVSDCGNDLFVSDYLAPEPDTVQLTYLPEIVFEADW